MEAGKVEGAVEAEEAQEVWVEVVMAVAGDLVEGWEEGA